MEQTSPFSSSPAFKFWRSLSHPVWKEAIRNSTISKKSKGSLISCDSNIDATHFILILSGCIKFYGLCESGKSIFIDQKEAGDACPIVVSHLLDTPIMEAHCIPETELTLLCIPRSYFFQLMEASPVFRMHVLKMMSDFSKSLINLVKEVSFSRLPDRVASHLSNIHSKRKQSLIPATHQDLANELGTTREVISRLLKDLETNGCIKLKRGAIEILSADKLRSYSVIGRAS